MKIAMVSPGRDNYSETFIKAQKDGLHDVLFFYDGEIPKQLEGYGKLVEAPKVYLYKIKRLLGINALTDAEQGFKEALKIHKAQVIITHFGPTAVKVLDVCQLLDLPLIAHFHGYDASMFRILEEYNNAYKEVFKYAHSIISVSNDMTEALIALGCPKNKIVYNPCTPDPDFLEIKPFYESNNILAVGRFTEKKGPQTSVKAFASLCLKYPNAQLIMIGDGPEIMECRALVEGLGLENRILFKGALPKRDIMDWMSKSRAFIQHSVTAKNGDKEGTPVAILEAGLAGLPVISTRHAGIKDVVKHNETGLLCEENDLLAYTKNLDTIMASSRLAMELGQNAKNYIYNNFNRKNQLQKLEKLLLSACMDAI
ncbi:glycosyltransferase [Winogradskyella maritima]|uniref:Glycosyltransferase n=1 Tax=Winogradskyella maritima TaxID=1517766 RepID=A0ABV8AGS4_9FLAO|nr:glycosyltransferase [Winogradskyella maritima]